MEGSERGVRRGAERSQSKDGSGVCIVPDKRARRKQASKEELKYIERPELSKHDKHTASPTPLSVL